MELYFMRFEAVALIRQTLSSETVCGGTVRYEENQPKTCQDRPKVCSSL